MFLPVQGTININNQEFRRFCGLYVYVINSNTNGDVNTLYSNKLNKYSFLRDNFKPIYSTLGSEFVYNVLETILKHLKTIGYFNNRSVICIDYYDLCFHLNW